MIDGRQEFRGPPESQALSDAIRRYPTLSGAQTAAYAALSFGGAAGRLSRLIPLQKPSARQAAAAKEFLSSLGLAIDNRSFDPAMN